MGLKAPFLLYDLGLFDGSPTLLIPAKDLQRAVGILAVFRHIENLADLSSLRVISWCPEAVIIEKPRGWNHWGDRDHLLADYLRMMYIDAHDVREYAPCEGGSHYWFCSAGTLVMDDDRIRPREREDVQMVVKEAGVCWTGPTDLDDWDAKDDEETTLFEWPKILDMLDSILGEHSD